MERDYFWNGSAWAKTNEVRFIYDGYLLIQGRDSNNIPKVTCTRGLDFSGSLQGAGGVGGLLARSDTNGTIFYHADSVGNITALMDSSENIVGRYLYGPSGNILAMSGPMAFANVMRSFSEPVHPLSGLLHLPFRDLNTRLPMFLTADPLGEAGGIPLHSFVHNNSVNHFDPFGLADDEDNDPTDRMLKRLDQGQYSQGGNRWTPQETKQAASEAKQVGIDAALIVAGAATGGAGDLGELGEDANLAKNAAKCEKAAKETLQTTAHGAERIAGAAATRGGVLSKAGVTAVREGGRVMTQADGATVRILQNESGRFNVVVEGERGIITTFENLSQKSLDRLSKNYGWK
jgi:RHS repeat-associated protein